MSRLWWSLLAGYAGACFGLVLGLIDAAVRIIRLHFEWFEVYTALLLPVLVFGMASFAVGLVLACTVWSFARKVAPSRIGLWLGAAFLFAYGAGVSIRASLHRSEAGESGVLIEAFALATLFISLFVLIIKLSREGKLGMLLPEAWRRHIAGFARQATVWAWGFLVFSLLWDVWQLHRVPSAGGKAQRGDRPNVIFITLDTVRADHLGIYGYPRPTSPNLDRFAQSAVVFEQAVSPTSWTLPAHASMFTGLRVSEHNATTLHQQLGEEHRTLAEILLEHGYATAGFVGGPYCKAKFGLGQGFQHYSDRLDFFEWNTTFDRFSIRRLIQHQFPNLWARVFRADGERTAPEIRRDALEWLTRNQGSPFFLFVNFFDAHDPYNLGSDYLHLFTSERRDYEVVDRVLDDIYYGGPARYEHRSVPDDLRDYMLALYDSEIRFLDEQLEHFLNDLSERGFLDDTVVIITADHGEEFFDHGGVLHRQTLFREVLHVPLLIRDPRLSTAGTRVNDLVGTVDLFPTVLELVGIPVPPDIPSRSLVPLLEGGSLPPAPVLSELYGNPALGGIDMRAVTAERWKSIDVAEERERIFDALYDWARDPKEQENIIHDHPDVWSESFLFREVRKKKRRSTPRP